MRTPIAVVSLILLCTCARAAPAPVKPPTEKPPPGLPITESYDDETGTRSFRTEPSATRGGIFFQATALREKAGDIIVYPDFRFTVGAEGATGRWQGVKKFTLYYGDIESDYELEVPATRRESVQAHTSRHVTTLTGDIVFDDFMDLAKAQKFYIRIGKSGFSVTAREAAGLQRLARRFADEKTSIPVYRNLLGRIVPGEGIGALKLGMTPAAARRLMGPPVFATRQAPLRGQGYGMLLRETWLDSSDLDEFDQPRRLAVIYERGKAIQIETESPRYATQEGLSTDSSLWSIFQRFKRMKHTIYGAYEIALPAADMNYYDDRAQGIAVRIGAQDIYHHSEPPDDFIVHRRGRPFVIDVDEKPN